MMPLAIFARSVAYDRSGDVAMTKRILLVIVGALAAAVMISTAADAVDIAGSSIEDGDGRYLLSAAGGLIFVVCLYLLVADLAGARRSRTLTYPGDDTPPAAVDRQSLADRLAIKSVDSGAASSSIKRGPIVVTPPTASSDQRSATRSSSGTGLFGAAAPSEQVGSAEGLFGHRPSPHQSSESGVVSAPTQHEPMSVPEPAPAPMDAPAPAPMPMPMPAPASADARPAHDPAKSPSALNRPRSEPAPPENAVSHSSEIDDNQPIALRDYDPGDIDRTIDEHNRMAVDALVTSGTSSSEGPLTAADIRTMLFIDLSSEQLRSILHEARDEEPAPLGNRQLDTASRAGSAELPLVPALAAGESTNDDATASVASHPDDRLPHWHVIDHGVDSDGGTDDDGNDPTDEPPSTGYLYATGGN